MTNFRNPRLPEIMEFAKLVDEIESKPDTDLVILSMAYLDKALEFAITSQLKTTDPELHEELFDKYRGSLKELRSKANLAVNLGIISPDVWEDVKNLSKVRNVHAHSLIPPTWDDPQLQSITDKLKVKAAHRFASNAMLPEGTVTHDDPAGGYVVKTSAGGTIDSSVHDSIQDLNSMIGFYCRRIASDSSAHRAKRRYLESFWTCIFMVMLRATEVWMERSTATPE